MLFFFLLMTKGEKNLCYISEKILCYIYCCVTYTAVLHIQKNSVLTYVCYNNRYIGICDMAMQGTLNFMQGRTRTLDLIYYNLFTAGGVSLQGEFSYTRVVIIKKGENVEAYKIERF